MCTVKSSMGSFMWAAGLEFRVKGLGFRVEGFGFS